MKLEIINIGDELLIGQVLNTNSAWIASKMNKIGIRVSKMLTIADDTDSIKNTIDESIVNADIIILTGGLGPTKDDITKKSLLEYFGGELVFNEEVYNYLNAWFIERGRTFSEVNKTQCYLPSSCRVLPNYWGTAPGMLFERNGKYIVSLPGVPYEMKNIIKEHLIPFLNERLHLPPLVHRTFLLEGIPESELMITIQEWENNLPPQVKLAYLPSSGIVKLRLTAYNEDGKGEMIIKEQGNLLMNIIGDEVFGFEKDTLESVILELLKRRNETITTAESCTGGYLAHKLTSVSGASKVFPGGFVTYDYWVKTELLGVKPETYTKHGAVSKEVVTEMAIGAKSRLKTNYAIALSGIAGPDGGTPEKPVGTVWIAWATPDLVYTKKFHLPSDRIGNIHRSYQKALSVLRKLILGIEIGKDYWE